MKKNSLIFSDLSKKQLQHLKEIYIQKKVDSMNVNQLKEFVSEIITHQITDTIDKEEEMDAWREMSIFFGEQFETVVSEIQQKFQNESDFESIDTDPQKYRQEMLERNNIPLEKKDMWDD